jgi:sugar/nucleoside kinase (ribokinase family)
MADADKPIDLLTYGDPTLDLVFAVKRAPQADEKRLGRRLGRFGGGTSANVGCAAARLGLAVAAYGRVGDDDDGRFLGTDFLQFGVAIDALRVVPATSSATAMIMIEPSGEKALVYAPMPGALLDSASLLPALERRRMVHATPYDLDELAVLSRLARQAAAMVALDMEDAVSADHHRLETILPHADLVFFNEGLFLAASGMAPSLENMRRLLDQGPHTVVVTLGAEGARAVTRDEAAAQAAFPARIVDATGAGDCFAGAFLAASCDGTALGTRLRFACAAASLAVTAIGARSALPDRAAVQAVMGGL